MAKIFKYSDINNELEKYISFLDGYKVKYKKFNFTDKNGDDIVAIVSEDKHSMLSESDWYISVFNHLNEKIVSASATNNCDYIFDKNYNIDCVKNVLENLGVLD